jgi:hypothetical protein
METEETGGISVQLCSSSSDLTDMSQDNRVHLQGNDQVCKVAKSM